MRTKALTMVFLVALGASARGVEQEDKKPQENFKVERNILAKGVHFDSEGRCQAVGKTELKAWYVRAFPAEIPPFESCTTISSPLTGSEVDIEMSIVDKDGERLLRVDGVLSLGRHGKASQAIDWDHLKIPEAGTYHFVIKINGEEIARYAMKFVLRKVKKRRR